MMASSKRLPIESLTIDGIRYPLGRGTLTMARDDVGRGSWSIDASATELAEPDPDAELSVELVASGRRFSGRATIERDTLGTAHRLRGLDFLAGRRSDE